MQTIRLKVNEKIYENLMWFLQKFDKDEIQIIEETDNFLSVKKDLHEEFNKIKDSSAEFIDLHQLEIDLENTIRKYED